METAMTHHRAPQGSHRALAERAGRVALLLAAIVTAAAAPASELLAPGLYQVTTETVMPHLEENLRYAITHEERCLTERTSPRNSPS